MSISVKVTGFCAMGLLLLAGCATVPTDVYVPVQERGVATIGLDEKDYQLAANDICQAMLKRGLPKGYVVTLGPVDTKGTPYTVDVEKIQDKIESILDEEGTLRFTVLKKALTEGSTAFDEIYKLIEYNWQNQNPMDAEDLQKFGKLAKINGILFGRVSSIQRHLPGGGTEVTYTFAWRLANTETGVNDMTLVREYRKNIR
jgi:PBP1b-binding outer membrane lipoprotein LpoB